MDQGLSTPIMTTDALAKVDGLPISRRSPTSALLRLKARVDASPMGHALLDEGGAVLLSYAQILFANSKGLGALLLAVTFLVPAMGLWGLFGIVLTHQLARLTQMNREAIRGGLFGYNALLVFLSLGAAIELNLAALPLALAVSLLLVWVHVTLSGAMAYHFKLPVLSLPFVFVAWFTSTITPYFDGLVYTFPGGIFELGALPGPPALTTMLEAMGAIFFVPTWLAGLVVFVGLILHSRISTVHALVGFTVMVMVDSFLIGGIPPAVRPYAGFNFVLTAVAVGGVFYVPGRASLLLAAAASFACGLSAIVFSAWLAPIGLAILALPFNATVLLVLYAMSQRGIEATPRRVAIAGATPEESLDYHRTRVRRFHNSLPVRLSLPFRGAWICTQGNDGEHTHQGAWRHGLDFEIADDEGLRYGGAGAKLTDWLCYRLPVCAPAAGTVVKVIDQLPDNPIGQPDTRHNFGNLVMIQHAVGVYSMLAHLSPGSVKVVEGTYVVPGQVVGLCGNSGRSPVPHLHVQLQAHPRVGEPTIAIAFHGAVVDSEDTSGRLTVEHLPREGETVSNLRRAETLGGLFAWEPGERLALAVSDGRQGGPTDETVDDVISDLDLIGNKSLFCAARRARLWFENRGDTFIVYDYHGPRAGALYALYCALARVPLEADRYLRWEDYLNPQRLSRSLLGWLVDATHAVLGPVEQVVHYQATERNGRLVITGHAPARRRWHRDVHTEAVLYPGRSLERVRATIGDRTIDVRWTEAA